MRVPPRRRATPAELGRRVLRLSHLPLRPLTARLASTARAEDRPDDDPETIEDPKIRATCELDPGWMLAQASVRPRSRTLVVIADRNWWPRVASSGPLAELLGRLWRHSVAVGIAARWLAHDAGDPDPDAVARAGQLCGLGYWAVAAVEPDWLVSWYQQDGQRRRQQERDDLGAGLDQLGRRLAERWDCDPLVIDSAWLHADHAGVLNSAAACPDRLACVQQAYHWAEQTPWSLGQPGTGAPPSEPRLRILMAEVQAKCTGPFVDADATSHEERMTRQNARLRRQLAAEREARARGDRFLQLLADSPPAETAEEWADRAALAWCAESDVRAARIVWHDLEPSGAPEGTAACRPPAETPAPPAPADRRPPALVLPLDARGGTRASIDLGCSPELLSPQGPLDSAPARRAWQAWAALLADRVRLERRLEAAVAASRHQVETGEVRLRQEKLDALAEFAGGAGHELNNPLAVIVGRAQLLLARTEDPEIVRSLRIILNQAQRTHRILRDLMFVARPAAPRCRRCRPAEVLLTLLREFERECAARGIRLVCDLDDSAPETWADPEALRHLAEILLRNALQATPAGGKIRVRSAHQREELVWSFSDTGQGIRAGEAAHLFDPFFCGRQAGRGLGLGLPRAARVVDLAGGQLRWTSSPGQETTFQVHLPLTTPPDPAVQDVPAHQVPTLQGQRLLKS